jgi:hypothetical protein
VAAHTTHLVVGERVFPQIAPLLVQMPSTAQRGTFLLGCVVVDVHLFGAIDRRRTHFRDGLYARGDLAYDRSCANFVRAVGGLLARPWPALRPDEQAFVAGYLCHLATDESWMAFCWRMLDRLGLERWSALPVPGSVLMTAYHVLSRPLFHHFASIAEALAQAPIPHAMTHVPHEAFVHAWQTVRAHVLDGHTPDSYLLMLAQMGRGEEEVRTARAAHDAHWEAALALARAQEDLESIVADAVRRSVETIPRLWDR